MYQEANVAIARVSKGITGNFRGGGGEANLILIVEA
jgi:hypothetical protein